MLVWWIIGSSWMCVNYKVDKVKNGSSRLIVHVVVQIFFREKITKQNKQKVK